MSFVASSRPKRIEKALTLIRPGIRGPGGTWADIGCGDGIFTTALHRLIRPGGEIWAIDQDPWTLKALARNLAQSDPDAAVHTLLADFTGPLTLPPLEGLVMANALHFVRKKTPLLARLAGLLKPGGRFIVVEYNTNRRGIAVPYPLDETGFLKVARDAGLHDVRILTRIPSTFLGEMYAGMGLAAPGVT